jgi:beta-ketodecanoyl-[acyl-carrier-protein] synthase
LARSKDGCVKIAISGTGLYTPPDSISNAELVRTYNEYVRRYNAAHHEAIVAGALHPLLKSSHEFIVKASGIHKRARACSIRR